MTLIKMMPNHTITSVPNVIVGNSQDITALTGCTVLLFPKGAVAGVDQRGGAPGTRETDLLKPMHLIQKVHAILLAGGSAFGLDAASGVLKYLEEKNIGVNVGVARIPIVPAAILFDLSIGNSKIRPDAQMGYNACQNASTNPVVLGNIGAGTGATVGKLFGNRTAMKTGLGSAVIKIGKGIFVGAIIAVNAFGDVIDPKTNKIISGARRIKLSKTQITKKDYFLDTFNTMKKGIGQEVLRIATHQNTIIGCVATNAKLTKDEANKVAQMAHNGIAQTIRPAHTMLDGDTLFAVSTGNLKGDVSTIGASAAEAVANSIISAVINANSTAEIPSMNELDQFYRGEKNDPDNC